MKNIPALILLPILLNGCAQIPSCALAKPQDGWHFIIEAPPELKVHQWPSAPGDTENAWVRHENGSYGQCLKRKNENYCFGLFEIYGEDSPILITSESNCES